MSLFLSSEPNWDSANFLSSTGLGKITRDMISEHFGIQVMFEKPHESLQGVTIGERSKEAQGVVDSISGLFEELKEGLEGKYKCPGEIVQEVIKLAGEEGNEGMILAKKFCQELVRLLPSLSESFSTTVIALPSTPLRLLQDLSTTSIPLHLPPLSSLSDISPLPLPIPPLLALRILSPSSDLVSQLPEQTSILSLLHRDKSTKALHGFSGKADETSKKNISLKGFTIPLEQITHLQSLSVEICQLIRDQARESGKEITLIDVVKFFDDLQIKMDKSGLGFRLIPSDS
ncbi:hypothetical protein TREMEDRAFT_63531 [Tremella mesenterica DSM 1558]|uniref:uncharacterized protein n=1 Tax=Tremella mesenterica (strain ATCC 24925 / CBS 8224 / DSM 1558 / NBRC 9311 / NRRL Y-6157 / RJB 2259-6 / UBC 559-6) TaxID=578456 RepID=UPI0003F4A2EA|nr:uncharacterized protein TREMEDRAFT_63531 [Tremella mesenterica DSM 1558]EIW68361.1 hypothetical protein TREMEDRAFT_63531 [Tremella mesenterica DSM 1558]